MLPVLGTVVWKVAGESIGAISKLSVLSRSEAPRNSADQPNYRMGVYKITGQR